MRPHTQGVALMLTSATSNQTGAGLGALAFPTIGPVGVVAVRQFVTAAILVPVVRPKMRTFTKDHWYPLVGLAAVFSVMNLSLYLAIERVGLATAVTLEFLGPLAVAITGSRRARDLACAILAGVGVVLLTRPGPTADALGIGLGLLAATAWASYILLNRTLGRRLPGLEGPATASLLTAAIWTPIAAVWFTLNPPTLPALILAVACGLLSSIVPYVTDLLALRRVPAHVFGTFTSVNPVLAAVAGWLMLAQSLGLVDWLAIGLIVLSNAVVSQTASTGQGPARGCG